MDQNDSVSPLRLSNRLSVVLEDSQEIDNPVLITEDNESDTSDFDVIELVAESHASSKGIARFDLDRKEKKRFSCHWKKRSVDLVLSIFCVINRSPSCPFTVIHRARDIVHSTFCT